MKKWFYPFLAATLIFSSCKKDKDCETPAPATQASASETAYLQNYLTANNITAVQTHGMFYVINNQGSGESPNLCSDLSVIYAGVLISGTTESTNNFDSSNGAPISLNLAELIEGWQLVLPLVKSGGTVTLYIPPSLGYGSETRVNSAGVVVLPANSYLKFVLTLSAVS